MRYAVLVKLKVPYGISVYYPQATTTAPAYPLPPPTTLVGALAYPYLRKISNSEVELVGGRPYSPARKLLGKVLYASAGAEGYSVSRDVERVFQAIYLRREYWGRAEMLYTIGVRGVIYYLDDNLYLLYVVSDRSLADYAYGIVRLGRKESIVTVEDVIIEKIEDVVKAVGRGSFKTIFYYPIRVATGCQEGAYIVHMPKLSEVNFTSTKLPETEEYCVPRGVVASELREGGALVSIGELDIPVPREVVVGA